MWCRRPIRNRGGLLTTPPKKHLAPVKLRGKPFCSYFVLISTGLRMRSLIIDMKNRPYALGAKEVIIVTAKMRLAAERKVNSL